MRRIALVQPAAAIGLCAALLGCGDDDPQAGVSSLLSLEQGAGFYQAPFPIEHRARADGSLRVADFPNDHDNALVDQLVELLEDGSAGVSPNAAIMVPFDGPIAVERLPADPRASVEPTSAVLLVNIDPASAQLGKLIPIEVSFKAAAESYSPANLLVALPFQGVVLEPRTRHALIVKRGLGDAHGRPLFKPLTLTELLMGDVPAGPHGAALAEAFAPLRDWLVQASIPVGDVAAATVFTTGDPLAEMDGFQAQLAAADPPTLSDAAFVDSYDGYCVIRATTSLPLFQQGPKPYAELGSGQLVTDADGRLVEQERDTVEIMLTVPHAPMPAAGFPMVIYAAGAEGSARQVIDRTALSADPDQGLGPPGQGPAKHFAYRGIAALGFPAPLAWDRHPDGDGGMLDFWNVANIGSFRGNIQQGILDISTLVRLVEVLDLDAGLCPQATSEDGRLRYDPGQLFLYGHSTGSTIGSASIALEPALRAAVLSGAGGSWTYNVALAKAPVDLSGVAALLLDYDDGDQIDIFDPALSLFQTALEPVEVMSWGRATVQHPLPGRAAKQLLLIQGVVDSYHFPRMVNAYAMSVGLDLAEPAAEQTAEPDYELVGRGLLPAPVTGNVDLPSGDVTAVTIQKAQNEQDGHYVPFEFDDVKYRYGCFLWSIVEGGLAVMPPPNDDPQASCQ